MAGFRSVLFFLGLSSGEAPVVDEPNTGGGGSKPRKPRDWNPPTYERKGLDKLQDAYQQRRLIRAAKLDDEFLLEAVKRLLMEAT